ncbi:MAG: arginine--tRNA ligase [Acidobacteriota bacterium]|nr:arginine--tRNA ligase [Acidobacteriota bacterium]
MYLELKKRLETRLREVLKSSYGLELETIPVEIPPELEFGELATPVAFELARTLRKAPKVIAQEIVAALGPLRGFDSFELAGAGYINARLERVAATRAVAQSSLSLVAEAKPVAPMGEDDDPPGDERAHALVEHTSINPNKAAHIGHLRNAILGDTFVRLLRAAGQKVDVQNYIDNTGVQVADVVVGFLHLEGKPLAEVRALVEERARAFKASGKFADAMDYYCWDLYARTSQWYASGTDAENEERKKLRYDTLHAIEHGGNETAEVAELISTAVLRRHLETMLRLGIEYDFLPRESEILHLRFWESAFELLKQTGVLYFETEGKNKGCWVMTRPGAETKDGETDEDAKVIVRSNGTVTYVGKDIAYHLWKFGLLGRDFGYKPFFRYPGHTCWISCMEGEAEHPHFGGASAIYNVIDSRQSDPQANVIQALRGMGHAAQADHYTHFSYEMVALTPRCAEELGYEVAEEDRGRPYIEVSGRKGFGVKADDLIDKLIAATLEEVNKRQTGRDDAERRKIAGQIAIGALRYFMLKVTRNSVIAFDFKDALSFEGETGPYIQYAVVRARNIFRKAGTTERAVLEEFQTLASKHGDEIEVFLRAPDATDIWALWLRAGRRTLVLEQCLATSEPAYLAKHAFQLAQEFNNFYHRHHILTEEDAARKTLLLATAAVTLRELGTVLSWLGIESPEAM